MTATGLYDARHGDRSTALIYILTTGRVPGYPVSYTVGYPGNELLDNGSLNYWYNENELPLPLLSLETFLYLGSTSSTHP